MNDSLGDRIKSQYEDRTRYFLPRRTYTILRLDGKAFHTYTRRFNKPFDSELQRIFDVSVKNVLGQIQGAFMAYHQSDEVSILLTDFATQQTCAWFDGNIQKISSVAASLMTAAFIEASLEGIDNIADMKYVFKAAFDCRAFTIPDRIEVSNYFIWRQKDCERNSIQGYGQSILGHKECHGKSNRELVEYLESNGHRWNEQDQHFKNGTLFVKSTTVEYFNGTLSLPSKTHTFWASLSAPIFGRELDLLNVIPQPGYDK